jgi:hypothetical protein
MSDTKNKGGRPKTGRETRKRYTVTILPSLIEELEKHGGERGRSAEVEKAIALYLKVKGE